MIGQFHPVGSAHLDKCSSPICIPSLSLPEGSPLPNLVFFTITLHVFVSHYSGMYITFLTFYFAVTTSSQKSSKNGKKPPIYPFPDLPIVYISLADYIVCIYSFKHDFNGVYSILLQSFVYTTVFGRVTRVETCSSNSFSAYTVQYSVE